MATYKHKAYRRYRIGKFEFKEGILVTKSNREDNEFRSLISGLPRREARHIVEINEAALAALERPVSGPSVIRGPSATNRIKSQSTQFKQAPELDDDNDPNSVVRAQVNRPSTGLTQNQGQDLGKIEETTLERDPITGEIIDPNHLLALDGIDPNAPLQPGRTEDSDGDGINDVDRSSAAQPGVDPARVEDGTENAEEGTATKKFSLKKGK